MGRIASKFAGFAASAFAGIATLWLGATFAANAQAPPGAGTVHEGMLAISIGNGPPQVFGSAEVQRLPHKAVTVKSQDGQKRKYAGVQLDDLLRSACLDFGGEKRPASLTGYLWVEGEDGVRVLFSGAEIDRFLGGAEILLADSRDGQAIAKPEGPYRLLVTSDKVHARWIRQVRALYWIRDTSHTNASK